MKQISPVILLSIFLFACSTTKTTSHHTTPPAPETMPEQSARIKDGSDFRASGNEPFWSLDIDFQGSMHFIDAEGYEFTVPVVKGERAMDANVTRYYSETEKGTLTVQLFNQPCEDSMSGKKNNFTVHIDVKKRDEAQSRSFKGCGNFIENYVLNDIWTLQRIGNKTLDQASTQPSSSGLPTLEINLNEGKVMGRGGCNRYSGSFSLESGHMTFGPLMSTKMACDQLQLEGQYLGALSDKKLSYTLSGDSLLVGTGSTQLLFKRGVN